MAGLVSVRSLMCWSSSTRPLLAADEPLSMSSDEGMAPRMGAGRADRAGPGRDVFGAAFVAAAFFPADRAGALAAIGATARAGFFRTGAARRAGMRLAAFF